MVRVTTLVVEDRSLAVVAHDVSSGRIVVLEVLPTGTTLFAAVTVEVVSKAVSKTVARGTVQG